MAPGTKSQGYWASSFWFYWSCFLDRLEESISFTKSGKPTKLCVVFCGLAEEFGHNCA